MGDSNIGAAPLLGSSLVAAVGTTTRTQLLPGAQGTIINMRLGRLTSESVMQHSNVGLPTPGRNRKIESGQLNARTPSLGKPSRSDRCLYLFMHCAEAARGFDGRACTWTRINQAVLNTWSTRIPFGIPLCEWLPTYHATTTGVPLVCRGGNESAPLAARKAASDGEYRAARVAMVMADGGCTGS